VGAHANQFNTTVIHSGAAYLFRRNCSSTSSHSLTQIQKFMASDQTSFDALGSSVEMEMNTIVVGAPRDVTDELPFAGSVYVFDARDTATQFSSSER
jgi:hypothetical protein